MIEYKERTVRAAESQIRCDFTQMLVVRLERSLCCISSKV